MAVGFPIIHLLYQNIDIHISQSIKGIENYSEYRFCWLQLLRIVPRGLNVLRANLDILFKVLGGSGYILVNDFAHGIFEDTTGSHRWSLVLSLVLEIYPFPISFAPQR